LCLDGWYRSNQNLADEQPISLRIWIGIMNTDGDLGRLPCMEQGEDAFPASAKMPDASDIRTWNRDAINEQLIALVGANDKQRKRWVVGWKIEPCPVPAPARRYLGGIGGETLRGPVAVVKA
jgi:hypothetical protein